MRVALYRRGKAACLLLVFAGAIEEYGTPAALGLFQQIGDNLEAAARVFGASRLTAFRRILLPLVLPSLASAMLVFALASRKLLASIVLASVGMRTIATFIWRQFEQGSIGLGMANGLRDHQPGDADPLLSLSLLRRSGLVAE